jgi:hypothetical protein
MIKILHNVILATDDSRSRFDSQAYAIRLLYTHVNGCLKHFRRVELYQFYSFFHGSVTLFICITYTSTYFSSVVVVAVVVVDVGKCHFVGLASRPCPIHSNQATFEIRKWYQHLVHGVQECPKCTQSQGRRSLPRQEFHLASS